jgi:hypothetical protein
MKKAELLFAACAVTAMSAIVLGVIKNNALTPEQLSNEAGVFRDENKKIVRLLQDARITASGSWSVQDEGKNLPYAIRSFDQDTNYEGGAGVKLSIFDEAGAVIYEDYFNEVQRIYPTYALRKDSVQLVMEVGYGGSASFFKMLDYQNGKVVDLMEAVEPDTDFHVGAEVRPQFRSGVAPAGEPYQVMLTSGVGLASPAEKQTSVFRYKGGEYRYAGKFSAQKVDDYIEKLIAEGSFKREKSAKTSTR